MRLRRIDRSVYGARSGDYACATLRRFLIFRNNKNTKINLKNKIFSEKITYGTFKAKNGKPESLEKHEFSFEGFPMNLKSFRIAKFQKNEETFSWSFFDEIWCKIKN